jgi:hypothetical protein
MATTRGAVSRPTQPVSKSFGVNDDDYIEWVIRNPPPIVCKPGCNKRFTERHYIGYAEGLMENIETVREELRPFYNQIRANLAETVKSRQQGELAMKLKIPSNARMVLSFLTQPATMAGATAVVNLINELNTLIVTLGTFSQLPDIVMQYGQQTVQLNQQIVDLYNAWVQGVVTPVVNIDVDFLDQFRTYLNNQPLIKPFTIADAEAAIRQLEDRGKLRLGELNQTLFSRLGIERPCCRLVVADSVRRGFDPDIPPVNEESAYRPHLWPVFDVGAVDAV